MLPWGVWERAASFDPLSSTTNWTEERTLADLRIAHLPR